MHTFEIHAGKAFYGHGLRRGVEDAGAEVVVPTEGMSMGRKLSHYAGGPDVAISSRERRGSRRGEPGSVGRTYAPPRGKYRPVFDHLSSRADERWDARLSDIEHIRGSPLPRSAREYSAWWANDGSGSHSHARGWLAAGWETSRVKLGAERVRFRRSGAWS
ncbi:MAG: hypothetical protein KY462_00170 [Actinobacteria bacterium]|nr:hypothetical protein [Actinomycetota bacterium]